MAEPTSPLPKSPSAMPNTAQPTLVEFLSTVPPPLTLALIQLAPLILAVRRAAEILVWKSSSSYNNWLVLAAWWAVCLLSNVVLRYGLPITALIGFMAFQRFRPRPSSRILTTEQILQSTIADLTALRTLISTTSSLSLSSTSEKLHALKRAALYLYIPYLILTFFVRLRVLLAITGTLLFTYPAPWARAVRVTLWRSAWVRWSAYRLWNLISGTQMVATHVNAVAQSQPQPSAPVDANVHRFLFTVYENQRWWMGLDWTAALLPGERPSWCSVSLQPLAPPSIFALPPTTSTFLPASSSEAAAPKGDAVKQVKRTAIWRWEEPEWRVVIHRDGQSSRRVERPLPVVKDEQPPPGGSNSQSQAADSALGPTGRLAKAAERWKDFGRRSGSIGSEEGAQMAHSATTSSGGGVPETPGSSSSSTFALPGVERRESSEHDAHDEHAVPHDDELTDADGWVYGDNKWEAKSTKGGLGKYTRYRRWTRIAILHEDVQLVELGKSGVEIPRPEKSPPPMPLDMEAINESMHTESRPEIIANSEKDRNSLRNRLNAAIRNPTL